MVLKLGILQGSVLGPILNMINTNNISITLCSLQITMYKADLSIILLRNKSLNIENWWLFAIIESLSVP